MIITVPETAHGLHTPVRHLADICTDTLSLCPETVLHPILDDVHLIHTRIPFYDGKTYHTTSSSEGAHVVLGWDWYNLVCRRGHVVVRGTRDSHRGADPIRLRPDVGRYSWHSRYKYGEVQESWDRAICTRGASALSIACDRVVLF